MRRLVVISAVVAALLVGTAVAVSAQTPRSGGWGCGGPAGATGAYDYTANPTFKAVADKLGVSVEDLAKELQAGKSVADVAGDRNVSLDDLVAIVDAPRKEMMGIMAKYGYATQEQLDSMNETMAAWQKRSLEQKGSFRVMGPGMMGGGMMGGGMMGGGMMGPGMMRGGGMLGGLRAN
jgi:hypothetical protein